MDCRWSRRRPAQRPRQHFAGIEGQQEDRVLRAAVAGKACADRRVGGQCAVNEVVDAIEAAEAVVETTSNQRLAMRKAAVDGEIVGERAGNTER
ncbi:MAG: hypothetical protein IPO66_16395 [Rhodanobacteraceae bacterium]|nr:hypothetical protein [Rhodanobacteraceae bacterium]